MAELDLVVERMFELIDDTFSMRGDLGKHSGDSRRDHLESMQSGYLSAVHEGDGFISSAPQRSGVSVVALMGTWDNYSTGLDEVAINHVKGAFSENGGAVLEDAVLTGISQSMDVSRLSGNEGYATRLALLGEAVHTQDTVGYARVLTENGLLLNANKDHEGAVGMYDSALAVLGRFESSQSGDARFDGAYFRTAMVLTGALLDGIKAGTFTGEDYVGRFEASNDLRERLAEASGKNRVTALAARARGEMFSWRAENENDPNLIPEAIAAYDVAADRYGAEFANAWGGVVLDLHRSEAYARSVDLGNNGDVANLAVAFSSVLDRSEVIPPHSLTKVNGDRFRYVAGVLDEHNQKFGEQSYTAAMPNLLSSD